MTIDVAAELDFSQFEVFSEPFSYAVSSRAFREDVSFDILKWLETEAPWKLVETDFYEQFELNFADAHLPDQLTFLQNEKFCDTLKSEIQKLSGKRLSSKIDRTAHKLISGQRIRIHNDFIEDGETYRLLIQLNRGWRDEDGGFLLFFNSSDPADIHKVFRPTHNSAVAFAISPNSNHAVTKINGSARFTLVYSFYFER